MPNRLTRSLIAPLVTTSLAASSLPAWAEPNLIAHEVKASIAPEAKAPMTFKEFAEEGRNLDIAYNSKIRQAIIAKDGAEYNRLHQEYREKVRDLWAREKEASKVREQIAARRAGQMMSAHELLNEQLADNLPEMRRGLELVQVADNPLQAAKDFVSRIKQQNQKVTSNDKDASHSIISDEEFKKHQQWIAEQDRKEHERQAAALREEQATAVHGVGQPPRAETLTAAPPPWHSDFKENEQVDGFKVGAAILGLGVAFALSERARELEEYKKMTPEEKADHDRKEADRERERQQEEFKHQQAVGQDQFDRSLYEFTTGKPAWWN